MLIAHEKLETSGVHDSVIGLGLRLRLERVLWTTPWLLDAGDEVGGIVGPP